MCELTLEDFLCRVPLDRATVWNRLKVSIDFVYENLIKQALCGVPCEDYDDQKLLKDAWVNLAFAQHATANYMTVGTMNVAVKTSTESATPEYAAVAQWANQFKSMGNTYLMQIQKDCENKCNNTNKVYFNPFA